MKIFYLALFICSTTYFTNAQSSKYYLDDEGEKQLCGPISIKDLKTDTSFSTWYNKSIEDYDIEIAEAEWANKLSKTTVEIYLGTWCGDSKNWVPKFIELWKDLGLDEEQLNLIALYDDDEHYKKGPNQEEAGNFIHRVPTFIFKNDGDETARIVEYPKNDLITDLAQIALGFPSEPNYAGANYLMRLIESQTVEEIKADYKKHLYKVYALQNKAKELNTLGYVYLKAGEIDKALLVFQMNQLCNRYNPNVYDSYAEALEANGNKKDALANYEKALALNPKAKNAEERIAILKKELTTEEN